MAYTGRKIIVAVLMVSMVTFAVPQRAYAIAWPDIVGQGFGEALDQIAKVIMDVQKAVVLVVLVNSITTQIEQIIDDSGGRITDWRAHLYNTEAAKIRAQNALAEMTRGATLRQNIGDIQDSFIGRGVKFATAALREDINYTGGSDFFRGETNAGTIDPKTGKIAMTNIAALTASFDPINGFMAEQIAKDILRDEKEKSIESKKLAQTAVGFDTANPSQTAAAVNTLTQSATDTLTSGIDNPIAKSILAPVLTRMMGKLGSKASNEIDNLLESQKALSKVYNAAGGAKQFQKTY